MTENDTVYLLLIDCVVMLGTSNVLLGKICTVCELEFILVLSFSLIERIPQINFQDQVTVKVDSVLDMLSD